MPRHSQATPARSLVCCLALAVGLPACGDDGGGTDEAGSTTEVVGSSSSGPGAADTTTTDAASSTGPAATSSTTDADTTEGSSDTGEPPPTGELQLDTILETNAVVATKGMDVDAGGDVWIWNYNQDNLERWDGRTLQTVVEADYPTSFGTDLSVDDDGNVVVSRGGSSTGETLIKWDSSGAPLWGDAGITYAGSLMLGLHHATVDGASWLFACDGAATGGQIHRIDPADGSVVESLPVADVPLDVAVDDEGNLYVLASDDSNPIASGAPVRLRKYDPTGALLVDGPQMLASAVYITRSDHGLLYVSISDFDARTRSIASFDSDLAPLAVTELPPKYEGFSGGITAVGEGDDRRVMITGQAGIGSGPICDVLVYREP